MDVNTKFVQDLQRDFPDFVFKSSSRFRFHPPKTIYYNLKTSQKSFTLQLLHELGHALSGHTTFILYIDRLKMEREAWERAKTLCEKYSVAYDPDFVEASLDTYRDWLHKKSLCKACGLTRAQSPDGRYHCPHCENFSLKSSP